MAVKDRIGQRSWRAEDARAEGGGEGQEGPSPQPAAACDPKAQSGSAERLHLLRLDDVHGGDRGEYGLLWLGQLVCGERRQN